MLSRTWTSAVPTTLGKEMRVFSHRLNKQLNILKKMNILVNLVVQLVI